MRQEFDAVQLKARKKRTILSALISFILIPLTIFVGIVFLDDQRYLLVSLFIVVYTMIPFFLVYENRKPKAREIVTIAMMSAIVVFFNMISYMMTPFQPGTALVIITGIAFGPEAGFLTGALARLILNVFMQQGPWTPWQMFGFGLIGFLAGVLFRPGALPRGRVALCVYGGLSTLILYGAIVNFGSLLMFGNTALNWAGLLAVYASGLPFDLVHAAATVLFLAILGPAMIEKLERLRRKYGLLETAA